MCSEKQTVMLVMYVDIVPPVCLVILRGIEGRTGRQQRRWSCVMDVGLYVIRVSVFFSCRLKLI